MDDEQRDHVRQLKSEHVTVTTIKDFFGWTTSQYKYVLDHMTRIMKRCEAFQQSCDAAKCFAYGESSIEGRREIQEAFLNTDDTRVQDLLRTSRIDPVVYQAALSQQDWTSSKPDTRTFVAKLLHMAFIEDKKANQDDDAPAGRPHINRRGSHSSFKSDASHRSSGSAIAELLDKTTIRNAHQPLSSDIPIYVCQLNLEEGDIYTVSLASSLTTCYIIDEEESKFSFATIKAQYDANEGSGPFGAAGVDGASNIELPLLYTFDPTTGYASKIRSSAELTANLQIFKYQRDLDAEPCDGFVIWLTEHPDMIHDVPAELRVSDFCPLTHCPASWSTSSGTVTYPNTSGKASVTSTPPPRMSTVELEQIKDQHADSQARLNAAETAAAAIEDDPALPLDIANLETEVKSLETELAKLRTQAAAAKHRTRSAPPVAVQKTDEERYQEALANARMTAEDLLNYPLVVPPSMAEMLRPPSSSIKEVPEFIPHSGTDVIEHVEYLSTDMGALERPMEGEEPLMNFDSKLWRRSCLFNGFDPNIESALAGIRVPGWNPSQVILAAQMYTASWLLVRIMQGLPLVINGLAPGMGKTCIGLKMRDDWCSIIHKDPIYTNHPDVRRMSALQQSFFRNPLVLLVDMDDSGRPTVTPEEYDKAKRLLNEFTVRSGPRLLLGEERILKVWLRDVDRFCPNAFKILKIGDIGAADGQKRLATASKTCYALTDKPRKEDLIANWQTMFRKDQARRTLDNTTVADILEWSTNQTTPPPSWMCRWIVLCATGTASNQLSIGPSPSAIDKANAAVIKNRRIRKQEETANAEDRTPELTFKAALKLDDDSAVGTLDTVFSEVYYDECTEKLSNFGGTWQRLIRLRGSPPWVLASGTILESPKVLETMLRALIGLRFFGVKEYRTDAESEANPDGLKAVTSLVEREKKKVSVTKKTTSPHQSQSFVQFVRTDMGLSQDRIDALQLVDPLLAQVCLVKLLNEMQANSLKEFVKRRAAQTSDEGSESARNRQSESTAQEIFYTTLIAYLKRLMICYDRTSLWFGGPIIQFASHDTFDLSLRLGENYRESLEPYWTTLTAIQGARIEKAIEENSHLPDQRKKKVDYHGFFMAGRMCNMLSVLPDLDALMEENELLNKEWGWKKKECKEGEWHIQAGNCKIEKVVEIRNNIRRWQDAEHKIMIKGYAPDSTEAKELRKKFPQPATTYRSVLRRLGHSPALQKLMAVMKLHRRTLNTVGKRQKIVIALEHGATALFFAEYIKMQVKAGQLSDYGNDASCVKLLLKDEELPGFNSLAMKDFQADDEDNYTEMPSILVCQRSAIGSGVTLSRTNLMVSAEVVWKADSDRQLFGRHQRMGKDQQANHTWAARLFVGDPEWFAFQEWVQTRHGINSSIAHKLRSMGFVINLDS